MEKIQRIIEDSGEKTQFLDEQNKCPLCCGDLDIYVESISKSSLREEARCTSCMALSRVENHIVH